MYLVELAVVDEAADDILHVVRCVRVVRHDRVEALVLTVRIVARLHARRLLHVVAREEGEQVADLLDAVLIVLRRKVCDAGAGVVRHRTTELLRRDLLRRDGLDDGRARDEHLARVLHHVDEVCERRAVDRTARAGPHDDGDLRNDARCLRVAVEDAAVARECIDCLLDACAARIVDADAGCPHLHGEVHDLPDLMCVLFAKRAALDREVLCECVDETAVNRAVARHNALAGQFFFLLSKIGAAMAHEHVELDEGVLIKQQVQALTRGEFALAVLFCDALFTTALHEMLFFRQHQLNFFLDCGHSIPPVYLSNPRDFDSFHKCEC